MGTKYDFNYNIVNPSRRIPMTRRDREEGNTEPWIYWKIIKAHRGHSHRSITGIYHHLARTRVTLLPWSTNIHHHLSIDRSKGDSLNDTRWWLKHTHFIAGHLWTTTNARSQSHRNGKDALGLDRWIDLERSRSVHLLAVSYLLGDMPSE